MSSPLASFMPVLLGVASAQVGQGLLGPLIPLLLVGQNVPTSQIGMVASAYSFGFLIGALYCQRLVLRLGHGRAFVAFAVLAADAVLLMALWQSVWGWALLRAISGIAYAGLCIVAESWLNARATNASRGRVFALYMVASWGGAVAGPLIMSIVPPSATLIAAAGMAYATALLPVALSGPMVAPTTSHSRMRLMDLLRISPVGLACGMAAGLANSVFHAMSPVYLQSLGHGAAAVALFATGANLAGLAIQMPAGMLSDRIGRRPVAIMALLGGGAAAVGFLLVDGTSFPVLLALGVVLSGLAAPLYGLGAGLINDRMESTDTVAAAGGLLLVWSVGATIGPFASGLVMEQTGPAGLHYYLVTVFAVMTLFIAWRMLLRPEVPRDQRAAFVPAASPPPGAQAAGGQAEGST